GRAARRRRPSRARRSARSGEHVAGPRRRRGASDARVRRPPAGGAARARRSRALRRRMDGAAAVRDPAPPRPRSAGARTRAPTGERPRPSRRRSARDGHRPASFAVGPAVDPAAAGSRRRRRGRSSVPRDRGGHDCWAARCPRRRHPGRGPRPAPREPGSFLGRGRGVSRPADRRTHGRSCPVTYDWTPARTYTDIRYDLGSGDAAGIAKITIDRPEVRNAFRPRTLVELADAFGAAREDPAVGVVVLTGAGPDAFCSGGDQRVRGSGGYVDEDGVPRLNVLDLQRQIRTLPKPVIAMVAGFAIGGGHVLHVVCDLTIAADNAVFGQTGPRVGSF